ncbi:TetR/AcrR family transcriptional regulator [Streptomyces sp. NPDC015125]|uniref:TetR/AcrR family transcriptional regulator n=1 Tax=Streptomyces sp. NPDC015125 TaxID=3364938 RepID=UPI0036F7FC96
MVLVTAALLREYGAGATSIDRVLAHSGAPRGSVHHHFPGGRAQLIGEAVAAADAPPTWSSTLRTQGRAVVPRLRRHSRNPRLLPPTRR